MKKIIVLLITLTVAGSIMAASPPSSYSTSRGSGTIMISGSGTYTTDLGQDLKSSAWNLGVDGALFLFPQLAGGIEFGYQKSMDESGDMDDPTVEEDVVMFLGPRAYFFLGGKNSELTPFVKGGANYLINKSYIDDDEQGRDNTELGLTASVGVLLNLAKNVGLSVEAEYNFEKGTAVEDIDTQQLLIKFGIRSFLSD
ncbi:MAG: outer membrane beta-barrel protein [Candidatus Marinimicrobia bacterium]|nr:outer membrane beta-barrel protein [Candidatus Neomarinimicrobiota bacterium]